AEDGLTQHALERWRANGDPLWALAAMARVAPSHAATPELLEAFAAMKGRMRDCTAGLPEKAVLPGMAFHAVRLMLGRGALDEAVALAAETHGHATPFTVRWLVANGHVAHARRLSSGDLAPLLDSHGRLAGAPPAVLNLLPPETLAQAALDPSRSDYMRRHLARVAFTRAYLLDGWKRARPLAETLIAIDDQTAPMMRKAKDIWSDRKRDHYLTLVMLRNPRFGVRVNEGHVRLPAWEINAAHPSDNNWWCAFDFEREWDRLLFAIFDGPMHLSGFGWDPVGDMGTLRYPPPIPPDEMQRIEAARDAILAAHPILKQVNRAELDRLGAVASGPKYLSEKALAWSQGSTWLTRLLGEDRGVAEALALSVRSTRYGCERAGGHGGYSRAAYETLHRRFPESSHAQATRWWFDCGHFKQGCEPYSAKPYDRGAWGSLWQP
ncbi:MAG TPA: hypothetical protein VLL76_02420, partial [Candidatus Omnitrophota bacterium]|nr:hypothetical protein [Candidatus Omnitrophota bacterium]